eukprot:scaffold681_cov130-Cylindrotheca_fusiformis.AAC.3
MTSLYVLELHTSAFFLHGGISKSGRKKNSRQQRETEATKKKQRSRKAGRRKKLEKSRTYKTCPINVPSHLGSRNLRTMNAVVSGTKNGNTGYLTWVDPNGQRDQPPVSSQTLWKKTRKRYNTTHG